jgi:L-glyceraldehyde reductase
MLSLHVNLTCGELTQKNNYQLDSIIKATGVVPAALQIERHPFLPNYPLIDYCKQKGIHVTAYSVCSGHLFARIRLLTCSRVSQTTTLAFPSSSTVRR